MDTKYIKKGVEILNYTKNLIKEPDWTLEADEEGVLMESKEFPEKSYVPCYRLTCTCTKSIDELFKYVWDVDEKSLQKDDPDVLKWDIIQSGRSWRIATMINDMPWPLSPREVVIMQIIFRDAEGNWLVSYSIPHEKIPIQDEYVRATVHISVYGFITETDNLSRIWRVSMINPAGDIPAFIVKLFADKQMKPLIQWK